jgi:hypothetical protein
MKIVLAFTALVGASLPQLAGAAEPPPAAAAAAPNTTEAVPVAPPAPSAPAAASVAPVTDSVAPNSLADTPPPSPAPGSDAMAQSVRPSAKPELRTALPEKRSGRSTTELEAEAVVDDGSRGSHQLHTYLALGYRLTRVASDGFEPFSNKPALNQFSVLAGRVLAVSEGLSFALGAGWEYGTSSADARGAETRLDMHRLTLMPEVRYHLLRRLYAFGRIGAGVAIVHAELEDSVAGTRRTFDGASFSVDPTLGLALELVGEPSGASRQPRVWLLLDGAYLFTSSKETVLVNESGTPARTDEYSFGDLALSGPSARLSAAFTF